jgi:hypothetical protein
VPVGKIPYLGDASASPEDEYDLQGSPLRSEPVVSKPDRVGTREWTRGDLNPRPLLCESSDLPLIYVPNEARGEVLHLKGLRRGGRLALRRLRRHARLRLECARGGGCLGSTARRRRSARRWLRQGAAGVLDPPVAHEREHSLLGIIPE